MTAGRRVLTLLALLLVALLCAIDVSPAVGLDQPRSQLERRNAALLEFSLPAQVAFPDLHHVFSFFNHTQKLTMGNLRVSKSGIDRFTAPGQTIFRYDGPYVLRVSRTLMATNTPVDPIELSTTPKQLQAKFKHAGDFGVEGNYNPGKGVKFNEAITEHINSPSVQTITGTYRGNPVTHYVDPSTGLNVIVDSSGAFVSGWKLNPAQLQNVLKHGGL